MKIWEKQRVPNNHWDKKDHRLEYMNWLESKLNINKEEDWYEVTKKDFANNKGASLINSQYKSSVLLAIKEYKPEYDWLEWKVSKGFGVPDDFWNDANSRKRYMKWLGNELGYTKEEDWYELSQNDFRNNCGYRLMNACYSINELVKEHLGDHIKPWLFQKCGNQVWANEQNKKDYLHWFEAKLNINKIKDWYKIKHDDFRKNKGGGLIARHFNNSLISAAKWLYPDYAWNEWLFSRTTKNFWKNKDNHKEYMDCLGSMLNFNNFEDWYRITADDFIENGGHSLLVDYYAGSPSLAVVSNFPEYKWEIEKFSVRLKKQKRLYRILTHLFPNNKIHWNYKAQDIRFANSNMPMQFDIYIPELKLVVEYQGEQHYFPIEAWGGAKTLAKIQRRDAEKRKACSSHNLTLIEVHYSWNGKEGEIKKLIRHHL